MAQMCINGVRECDGCGDCEPKYFCPRCKMEVFDTVYFKGSEVVGCEHCIESKDVGDVIYDEAH